MTVSFHQTGRSNVGKYELDQLNYRPQSSCAQRWFCQNENRRWWSKTWTCCYFLRDWQIKV